MSTKTKSIAWRFIKGAISGAITSLALITYATPTSWTQLGIILNMLAISAVAGAVNGIILAGQKWYSWKN